ncbi:MAG: Asp-tRNA(Asn)/Glu-tRNA(Gln) amidotransferase subunit GatC [Bdellovibrionales bacterium]|nr:Asp-tRNA(Asn)/Glu-tRNA(Gln) amidotransferase subunit GatC [Bdellovibrionales bacterium]
MKKPDSGLDLATVQKVANLARLKISDAEAMAIAGQLSAVLENFKQLAAVDTTGIEPLVTPTDLSIRLREDEAVVEKDVEAFVANAPARSGNLFKVPPVVGG